ncbi:MAG TPA: type VI secretion system ATPase TssH [Polyangiales bacterium]|nr:type VI secretion system ATPase TssH [Polyangiales bacterium]
MSEIRRETLFGKLNEVAFETIESSTLFAKMRGNPQLEPVHWVQQLLEHPDSDWRRIVSTFDLDASRLAADLTSALDTLPRGASAVRDLSPQVDLWVERAWVYTSLLFRDAKIRTGHLLFAALKTPELTRRLVQLSRQFERISVDDLADRFDALLRNAPETAQVTSAAAAEHDSSPATLQKQEALRRYAVDLTERARKNEIDPIVGRDAETRQLIDILMRRRQNNPILTGEAGVGKTAVVEGLALRIANGDVPAPLKNVALLALDLGALQAGAGMKGEFEQRLRQVIDEVQASPRPIILFIDEAHTLIGAGGSAGTGDAANLLKPALARGDLRTIAATTWAEYKKHIEKDPALTRRFQLVQVAEPNEAVALRMMRGVVSTLEAHHRVQVLDGALVAAVKLSQRYIPARQLPDKSVSLLDTACARVAVSQHAAPAAVDDSRATIEAIETELAIIAREAAVGLDVATRQRSAELALHDERRRLRELELRWHEEQALITRLLTLRDEMRRFAGSAHQVPAASSEAAGKLFAEHAAMQAQLEALQGESPLMFPAVDEQAVSAVVSEWTGIPMGRMVRNEIQAVLGLADKLTQRVVGQRHALDLIAQRIQTTRAGLEDPRKPIGVFLLAGPSGVGKTETALALAEALFGSERSLITINMSEFQEAHTVSTLKGAPPGYVGYGEGGVLTEAVRRRPYSVVLLDEVEKAHPDVHEIFFQVFDKGVMEDGEGRSIDFKNTLILLTTNAGSDLLMKLCSDEELMPDAEALTKALREPLLKVFPPALLGRMLTIPYYPLSSAMIASIVQLQLDRIVDRVAKQHGVPLRYDGAVPGFLAARCTELESGARMIESLLANMLLPRLSREFLTRLAEGSPLESVDLSIAEGELQVSFA